MVLIGLHGNPKDVNTQLMFKALEQEPTLVIDCANSANAQEYKAFVDEESFKSTYVVEVDLIYKFRDTIRNIPTMARRVGVNTIIVTTFNRLSTLESEGKNQEIFEHAWVLLSELSTQHTVIVGVHEKQLAFAQKYCHRILNAPMPAQ